MSEYEECRFPLGSHVEVTEGSYKGERGNVVRVTPQRRRVRTESGEHVLSPSALRDCSINAHVDRQHDFRDGALESSEVEVLSNWDS